MKKAKEYAKDILSCNNESERQKVILDTADELINEIQEIAKTRNIKTNIALKSIILEQNRKWKAVCRRTNKEEKLLIEDGFMKLLYIALPATKLLFE